MAMSGTDQRSFALDIDDDRKFRMHPRDGWENDDWEVAKHSHDRLGRTEESIRGSAVFGIRMRERVFFFSWLRL